MTRDVSIRKAATLLLVRNAWKDSQGQNPVQGGVEVLAMRRSAAMRFLPGHLAFPGGTLDAEDSELAGKFSKAIVMNQGQEDDVAYAAGALRECAEEVSIACAVRSEGILTDLSVPEDIQKSLLGGSMTYQSFLDSKELEIDFNQLRFVGRWVTPAYMPARFDTRFFLYRVQNENLPLRVSSAENDWAKWVSPDSALKEIENGLIQAVPPTIAMLRSLRRYPTVDACFAELSVPGPDENSTVDPRSFIPQ